MKTVKTGVPSPVPNQSMASTSQAMGGVPSSTVTQGRAIMEAVMETPAATPATLPRPTASASPASARRAEMARVGHSGPPLAANWRRVSAVSSGVGSTSGPYRPARNSHRATSSNRLAMAPQPPHR